MKKYTFLLLLMPFVLVGAGCTKTTQDVDPMPEEGTQVNEIVSSPMILNGSYDVDLEQSVIHWHGEKLTGEHDGTIRLHDGDFTLEDGVISGEVVVDMQSIALENMEGDMADTLLKHLKSDDFFGVEEYPVATMSLTSIEDYGDGTYMFTGPFIMRDRENEIQFIGEVSEREDGGYRLISSFSIDRTLWDVKFGSATLYGDALDVIVDDMIDLELDITFSEVE